jgi:hypothetical protein
VSPTEGYVLWTRSDTGQAALWRIDPSGLGTAPVLPLYGQGYAAHLFAKSGIGGPWQATSYEHVSRTEGYVLWTRSDTGQAAREDRPGVGQGAPIPLLALPPGGRSGVADLARDELREDQRRRHMFCDTQ